MESTEYLQGRLRLAVSRRGQRSLSPLPEQMGSAAVQEQMGQEVTAHMAAAAADIPLVENQFSAVVEAAEMELQGQVFSVAMAEPEHMEGLRMPEMASRRAVVEAQSEAAGPGLQDRERAANFRYGE